MKRLIFAMLYLLAGAAFAQTCDVTYTIDTDVVLAPGADPVNFGTTVAMAYGIPLADAEDNTRLGKKIISAASDQDGQGGPYIFTYSEMRSCNGGPATKADGVFVKGVTLKGANKVARVALKVADEIVQRYEKRAAKGDKFANDHSKAKAIKRDPNTAKRERQPIVAGD
jgi:hypothetical protein